MRVFHIVATLGVLAASPAFAADIVTITPNPAPSGQAQSPAPFTYRGTSGSRTQQVYASSFFSGPQMLTSLAFRSTPGFRNGANYASVNISLSTTMFGDETGTPLSADFSSNIGSDVMRVYQGAISFAAPTTDGFEYIVNFENAFRYDPSMGNLLHGVYSVNSVFDGAATSGIANTAATITQFTGTALAGAVPEPDTWALMIGGFGVVGGAMRRRRVSTKAVFA